MPSKKPEMKVYEGDPTYSLYQVTFSAEAPNRWPVEKSLVLKEEVKQAFIGAEKWLHDQLQRIDTEFELVRR